jgi:hypothetical protein
MSFYKLNKTVAWSAVAMAAILSLGSTAHAQKAVSAFRPRWYGRPSSYSVASEMDVARGSGEIRQNFSYERAGGGKATTATVATGGCRQQAVHGNESGNAVAAAPRTERRSSSYEPAAPPVSTGRVNSQTAGPKNEPRQSSNSDPRRYETH